MDQPKTSPPRLVSFAMAAEQLSISRRTLERLVSLRALRALRVGRRRLVEEAEITRFIEKSRAREG
jgi:excisionase family DNA binding protein